MKILDALSGRRGVSKRLIIAVCSVVYFVSYLSRKNFAVVMAAMISGDVIDKVLGGFIGMGMFVLYGVGQVVSGYLGDKIKPVWLMTAGIAMAMVTNALMPLAAEVNTVLLVPIWSVKRAMSSSFQWSRSLETACPQCIFPQAVPKGLCWKNIWYTPLWYTNPFGSLIHPRAAVK